MRYKHIPKELNVCRQSFRSGNITETKHGLGQDLSPDDCYWTLSKFLRKTFFRTSEQIFVESSMTATTFLPYDQSITPPIKWCKGSAKSLWYFWETLNLNMKRRKKKTSTLITRNNLAVLGWIPYCCGPPQEPVLNLLYKPSPSTFFFFYLFFRQCYLFGYIL